MKNMFNKIWLVIILGLTTGSILFSWDQSPAGSGEKIGLKIMEKEAIGKYLADDNGMTLYSFAKDEKNNSNCIEGCALNWPPFHSDTAAVGKGLVQEDFAVISRTDGRQQTTYKGMPLYYFKNDKYPGDTFGQGIGEVWHLVIP